MQRWILIGALATLSGCVSALPLPVNPFQIFLKEFPTNVEGPGGIQRTYTIKGETFAYPNLGFEITKADEANWQFVPGPLSVTIRYRNPPQGLPIVPAMAVQFVQIDKTFDEQGDELADLVDFYKKAGGAGSVQIRQRLVGGQLNNDWQIDQIDTNSGVDIRTVRLYTAVPGLLVLTQLYADADNLTVLGPTFLQMLGTLKLPAPQGNDPAPVAKLPDAFGAGVAGSVYTDGLTKASLTLADANWHFGMGGAIAGQIPIIAANRPGVSAGTNLVPQLAMEVAPPKVLDLDITRRSLFATLLAAKTIPQVTPRLVSGVAGEQWVYEERDEFGQPQTTRKVFVRNALAHMVLTGASVKDEAVVVQADFDKMIDSVTLPKGDALPLAAIDFAASEAAVVGAASGATAAATASSAAR